MERPTVSGSDLPSDIWWRIMAECGPEEIVALERCCKILRELARSRMIWLKCLQRLGPYEPPSIPRHVLLPSLCAQELRSAAVAARRRTQKWESESSPTLAREIHISLENANPGDVLGEPIEFGMQLYLSPGGEYLLIYWPAGYLQCWSVHDKTCLWVYPDLPEGASEDRPKLLWEFDFDMQENGDVHFLMIDERLQGDEMGDRYPNILRFSPRPWKLDKIHSGRRLDREYGLPAISKLRGNVVVIYQQLWEQPPGHLTISFWKEDKCLTMANVTVDCLEVTDEVLICLLKLEDGNKSLVIMSLADILRAATPASEPRKRINLLDIKYSSVILEPKSFSLRKTYLTVDTLHWKAKADQNNIYVTVLYKDTISRGIPFARLVLEKNSDPSIENGPLHLTTMHLDDDDVTSLILSGKTFVAYTTLTPPTLSGQSLILMHSSHTPAKGESKLALAGMTPEGKMKFKTLDLGIEFWEWQALCTEFYTGAIVCATEDYSSVMIKYFE